MPAGSDYRHQRPRSPYWYYVRDGPEDVRAKAGVAKWKRTLRTTVRAEAIKEARRLAVVRLFAICSQSSWATSHQFWGGIKTMPSPCAAGLLRENSKRSRLNESSAGSTIVPKASTRSIFKLLNRGIASAGTDPAVAFSP